jgi:hypothetical protein
VHLDFDNSPRHQKAGFEAAHARKRHATTLESDSEAAFRLAKGTQMGLLGSTAASITSAQDKCTCPICEV